MINVLLLATQIFVNGHALDTTVIETNGTLYVPIDAIAHALGVDVTIKNDSIQISSPPPAPAAVAAPAPPPAPVAPVAKPWSEPKPPPSFTAARGRLTWSMNMFTTLPERNAEVWLVPEARLNELANAAGGTAAEPIPTNATGWPAKLDSDFHFLKSVADHDGKFGFDNLAPGSYTLILQAKRSNGLAARDRRGKMRFKNIVVHNGEIVDASLNFGVTAYKD